MIGAHLRDFLERGGRAKILVGDYLDVTEPTALRRLNDLSGNLDVRVYEARERGFHPKAYIFRSHDDGIAFVGSSNLSGPALTNSVEWNYKVVAHSERAGFSEITAGFESVFVADATVRADEAWISAYEARRTRTDWRAGRSSRRGAVTRSDPSRSSASRASRPGGDPTGGLFGGSGCFDDGLGKTWLSAFNSDRSEFRRVLFVAHREEIFNQAIDNFRRVRPKASIGRLAASERDTDPRTCSLRLCRRLAERST